MKARHFLLPLSALLVVIAFGTWQWLSPAPARAPSRPSHALENTPPNPQPRPQPVPGQAASVPDFTLGEAGPAPEAISDPNAGQVWLRVVDDESGRPLVRTRCELWGVYAGTGEQAKAAFEGKVEGHEYDLFARHTLPIRVDTTDDKGCLKLSATPTGIDPERASDPATEPLRREGTRKRLSGFDVDFPADEVGFLYPIPPAWEPVTSAIELAARIAALKEAPARQPLEVRLRRAPVLSGRVATPEGVGLEGCTVLAFPVEVPAAAQPWVFFHNGTYRNLHSNGEDRRHEHLEDLLADLASQIHTPMHDAHWRSYWLRCQDLTWGHARYEACETRTDGQGRYRLPLLCRGRWCIAAFRHDCSLEHTQHQVDADATRDFTLAPGPWGRLVVRVHHHVATADTPAYVTLTAEALGPTGMPLPLRDQPYNEFLRTATTGAITEFVMERAPPGLHLFRARVLGQGEFWDSAVADVQTGKTTTLDLTPGATGYGILQPEVFFDGAKLDFGRFLLVSTTTGESDEWTAHVTDDGPPRIRIPADSYRAYFQGLAPIGFSIAADETLPLRVDLPVAKMAFSISAELHAAMAPESVELDQRIWLELNATSQWTGAAHLSAIGMMLAQADPEYDELIPGKNRHWKLPPGEYIYQIRNSAGLSIEGPLTAAAGSHSVTFGLDNLPGLGVIRVDLAGFSAEDDPMLEVATLESPEVVWFAWHSMEPGQQIISEDESPAPSWHESVTEIWLGKHTCWLVTGRGRRLSVTCLWAETEYGKAVTRAATAPGSIQFRPEDPTPWGSLRVLKAEADEADYQVQAVSADHRPTTLYVNNDCQLRPGTWRLLVRRYREATEGTDPVTDYGTVEVTVDHTEREVNLTTLAYQAAGKVTFKLHGRGTTEPELDPWWEAGDKLDFRSPILLYLDATLGGASPGLYLGQPSEYEHGKPPRLVYEPIYLPPGRYRVLPWFDAPGRLARDFEVKPGQTIEVVIQGG